MSSHTVEDSGLKRGLKARHLQMIALGSSIGTGLFLGSGASITLAGPAVLLGFILAGTIIFLIMRMLGEMAVAHPVSGSFSFYARKFIGPIAGFITGWNWWFTCIVVGMLELTAAGAFMDFWFPGHPHWVTALVCLLVITAINLIHVGAFGEVEFWMSMIKVVALIAMIVLGFCLVLGVGPNPAIGFSNLWAHGGFSPTGLGGFMLSLVAVTFTFGGVVSIGTAAGEVENPTRNIPKAINSVIFRVIVFYVGGVGIMLLLWPWNQIDATTSPFVSVLVGLGIGGAAIMLNVVVLAAALSVFNTMTYSGARMLRDLALNGQAPPFFTHTTRRGLPLRALLFNSGLMGGAVLLNFLFQGQLLFALMAIILAAEIISWSAIAISHLRFRAQLRREGQTSAYRSPFSPLANYLCLAFFALLLVLMGFLPDYRIALFALPLWIMTLALIWLGQQFHQRRHSTVVAEQAPKSCPDELAARSTVSQLSN
ncbi:Phenylalanine-specific permease [Corynebacterium occultum]|uniref:Phenylalanine-specific permease n=1 Tax=Corynebacterium occultum TaxID=2675219 RepID=A0A6B8W7N1_9CORY|nr:amino acid permease [Corynebacterium occultum]QGU08661.1 Phenylalanine-specific permease [Corynebacterium occultum]